MSEVIELNFKYKGALIEGSATGEEDYNGWTFLVELNEVSFRLYCDDNGEWDILRDKNALAPSIEPELIDKITTQIKKQRHFA